MCVSRKNVIRKKAKRKENNTKYIKRKENINAMERSEKKRNKRK